MAPERLTKAEAKARTRRKLLDAASELFFERGFGTTSLDDIAAHAGLTKGAVYSSFESKSDLLIALLEEAVPGTVDVSMFGTGGTFGDQVRRFGEALAAPADTRHVAMQAEYVSHAIRDERAGTVYADLVRKSLRSVAETVEAALAESDDGHGSHFTGAEVVLVLDALINGLWTRKAINPDLVPDDLIVRAVSLVISALVIDVVDADEALALRAERYGPPA